MVQLNSAQEEFLRLLQNANVDGNWIAAGVIQSQWNYEKFPDGPEKARGQLVDSGIIEQTQDDYEMLHFRISESS